MSKIVSILSVAAAVALLLVLECTLVNVTGLQPQVDPATASTLGTTFTYQGYLTQSEEPANGTFDFAFSLYDNPDPEVGTQVGATLSRTLPITDGLFTVELDFGSVFDGTPLWLELAVRAAGQMEPFTRLLPRQRLTPTPYSTFATSAASAPWAGLVDVPGGFADNVDDDRLASLVCTPGQIPKWNGTIWICGDDNVGTGGGGGDITAVHAGYGLGGGSDSGDVSMYVLTETVQTRVAEICPSGASIQAINQDGSVICEPDDDTTYFGGNQITLNGTTFDLVEGAGSGLDADLLDGQDSAYYRAWGNLTAVPAGLNDGDDDTTYSAGNQITLTGTTFDLVEGTGSGLDADLLDGQDGNYYRAWSNLTGIPADLDDGDDDTLSGLLCSDGQLPKWDETGDQWTCAGDLDTTYQPGAGLTLSDTTFAISTTYQLPQTCSSGQTVKWNGSAWACGTDELGGGESAWLLTGNTGTSPITNYLGTTDNQALEFRVDGSRALRIEPSETSPNILGGYGGNSVAASVTGATIGGGGRDLAINQANGNYSTVDGGAGNTAGGYASVVGGGEGNSANGSNSAVGGGSSNAVSGDYATAGGGRANVVSGTQATVAGGGFNQANTAFAAVGGGYGNVVSGTYATVSGGAENEATEAYASIAGGRHNRVAAAYGTVAGGGPADPQNPTTTSNRVYDEYGTVGGGGGNVAGDDDDGDPAAQQYATVGGGEGNTAGAGHTTVSGGFSNTAGGYGATVGGGVANIVTATSGTIAGGTANVVTVTYGTVGGGRLNKATGTYATVGGGNGNVVAAPVGTIPGGAQNYVGGNFAFAAGYQARAEHTGAFVWSDPTGAFTSTAPNQFLIDASGGVGIGTNAPSQVLTVQGSGLFRGGDAPVARGYYPGMWRLLDGASAVFAAGNKVYVTASSTNTLSIFNVADPDNIEYIGHSTANLSGPRDLFVSGQRAYVASENNNRLVVFDLSNRANPDSLGSTDESLTSPVAVYVAGKYAYVASHGSDLIQGGLAIFDISDPRHIRLLDFVRTNLVAPNDIYVVGNLAYVTDDTYNRLAIFDVSDPRPGQTQARGYVGGAFSAPRAVFVSGPYAYVVAENSQNLVILDVSDPDNIVVRGSTSDNLYSPTDVFVAGPYAYVTSKIDGRLSLFDISDPDQIVALGFVYTPHGPASLFVAGKHAYVANQVDSSLSVYDVTHLEAPTLETGNLQSGYLDVAGSAAIGNDLAVHGGLQVGAGGAFVDGALTVAGQDDSHILAALSVGGAGALISDTVFLTRTLWMTAPTHALDVIGEGRFRVNDYNNLVLRSANAGGDEDAYIDLVRSDQTTVLTPSARIEFDAADPFTHTTGMRFYTQGPGDGSMRERLRIDEEGDLLPASDGEYSLGSQELRWAELWTVSGLHQLSDRRYKENIRALTYGLEEIRALRPVAFAWRGNSDQEAHYGFIAQEVRELLPEVVTGSDGADGTLSMDYSELVPVLVKAVQEQQNQIESQEEQIAALEARLAALEDGQTGQFDQSRGMNSLTTLGFGGLVLGAVVLVGLRKGGRP